MSEDLSDFLLSVSANVIGTLVGGVLVLLVVDRWLKRKLDQWNSPEAVEARRVRRAMREEQGDAFGQAIEESMRRKPPQHRARRAARPK